MFKSAREFLLSRAHAYRNVFRSPLANIVLADLAKFCRANETTFNPDPRAHALLEGRREVWLRIQQHLNLSEAELVAIYKPIEKNRPD